MTTIWGLRCSKICYRGVSSCAQSRSFRANDGPVVIHPEVEDALLHHKPVVALETALVSHGLPHPTNLEVPLGLEQVVRSTGSIPATIGIIEGKVKIGLERHEMERLADRNAKPVKVSRRDIAAAIATKAYGGGVKSLFWQLHWFD